MSPGVRNLTARRCEVAFVPAGAWSESRRTAWPRLRRPDCAGIYVFCHVAARAAMPSQPKGPPFVRSRPASDLSRASAAKPRSESTRSEGPGHGRCCCLPRVGGGRLRPPGCSSDSGTGPADRPGARSGHEEPRGAGSPAPASRPS